MEYLIYIIIGWVLCGLIGGVGMLYLYWKEGNDITIYYFNLHISGGIMLGLITFIIFTFSRDFLGSKILIKGKH